MLIIAKIVSVLNIHLKGNLTSESELIRNEKLPHNAILFKEGKNIRQAFYLGFLLVLPIMIPIIIVTIIRYKSINMSLDMNIKTGMVFAGTLFIWSILIYIHEFIHAMFYSIKAEKTIWRDKKYGAYFVYCSEKVSKTRFVILCIAPTIILGIIPFTIWMLYYNYIPMPFNLAFVLTTWVMIVLSAGDFTNIYNAIKQVPKGAKIFNYGLHSYWIKDKK